MKTLLLTAFLAAAALNAADEKAAPAAKAPAAAAAPADEKPAAMISAELQMEYFRTDGALAHLKADLERANAEYDAAVSALVKACGEGNAPTLTQDKKRLFCVAQPAAAPAAKK
jgi:hypothetical protein